MKRLKRQIHHLDGNAGNNDPSNLRIVQTWENLSAPVKRPRGRPEVPPEQRLEAGSIRLTRAQWDKLAALGDGEWLRKQIDRAKVKA